MDEFGQIRIPIQDKKHLKYDIVGEHLANYDFMINLAHFKGHAMGGFGGVMKNASIGVVRPLNRRMAASIQMFICFILHEIVVV